MLNFIILTLGILMTLTAFRVINWSKNDRYEVFYSKYARALMVGGPILTAIGILMLIF